MAVVTDEIERGNAVVIAGDSFAVDNAGARAQASQRLDDQREAVGEVIAGPAVKPHLGALLAGNDAEAVMLDLVQPGGMAPRIRVTAATGAPIRLSDSPATPAARLLERPRASRRSRA